MEKTMQKESFYKAYIKPLLRHKVFSLFMLLVALVILFSLWSSAKGAQFFKASTLRNIFNSLVLSSFLTMGAGCLLISGNIDLSQASIGAFGSMVLAAAINGWGLPWFVGVILSLLLCALFGALNATLVSKFRFPAFIATLAMASMARGLMYLFSSIGKGGQASNIAFQNDAMNYLGTGMIGEVPIGIIVMLIFFLVYGILLAKSKFGLKVALMGGNPVSANLAGINSKTITYILFINSSVLGGIAGVFNAARLQQGSLMALQTNQFTGITAAILGGISFGGGSGGMGGAFVGLLILNTFQIGMGVVSVNPYWINVFTGILLLVALSVDFLTQMRSNRARGV
ncbi:MAG: ABC transporter permease [Oscillospiraceae bacterium]|jgi:ribose/xylose/arabinose/galactoside ABC-type transport system permease subunit|nr:ABC transporter permease [Oscillospiraceae bacterium]